MAAPVAKRPHILALFDVDGTLTIPRGEITQEMADFMASLRGQITTGVVGGSDMPKQQEQLGPRTFELFDYNFAENGLVAYKDGKSLGSCSIIDHLGEDNIKRIANWTLRYLSGVEVPKKRGTFFEFRSGMINISPIGRSCSRPERDEFEAYDKIHNIRATMVEAMKAEFADLKLTFSIGGQISFDVFPEGWDKTYCLRYLPEETFTEVHFFGDKTFPGGNDYEIFSHPRIFGRHTVTGPDHTRELCQKLFFQ